MSLDAHIARIRQFRDDRGWSRYHTPKNLALSVMIESAELAEHFQWADQDDEIVNVQDVAQECADVAIYLLNLTDIMGIDLDAAIQDKITENEHKYPVQS
jgi:dCTP diphosphatase